MLCSTRKANCWRYDIGRSHSMPLVCTQKVSLVLNRWHLPSYILFGLIKIAEEEEEIEMLLENYLQRSFPLLYKFILFEKSLFETRHIQLLCLFYWYWSCLLMSNWVMPDSFSPWLFVIKKLRLSVSQCISFLFLERFFRYDRKIYWIRVLVKSYILSFFLALCFNYLCTRIFS